MVVDMEKRAEKVWNKEIVLDSKRKKDKRISAIASERKCVSSKKTWKIRK